jgi:hypothetical protein
MKLSARHGVGNRRAGRSAVTKKVRGRERFISGLIMHIVSTANRADDRAE